MNMFSRLIAGTYLYALVALAISAPMMYPHTVVASTILVTILTEAALWLTGE